ncbi:MAG TPA: sugar kinase [Clostridiales bacterium]|jgi:sugar/nucleoside kinase (ribokinase family)|nr:sugar kinase [Clostridiales bacterium]
MRSIWTMGEMIVEIMRPREDMPLDAADVFLGPYPSGAPAIFADTVAKMGKKSGIIGGVGKDDFGKCLLERLQEHGVDCRFVNQMEGCSTGVAFVTYFSNGDRKFIFHIGNTPAAKVESPDISGIEAPSFFHLMGCSLTAKESFYKEIIKTLYKFIDKGAKISFDPNIRPELIGKRSMSEFIGPVLENCSVLMPGVGELLNITQADSVEHGLEKLFQNPKLEIVALKKGSQGCSIYTREEQFNLGVYPVTVKDTTGAGDSFDAAFLCGLIDGLPLLECAKIASAAAAINSAAFGPMEGLISPESVKEMIDMGNSIV